MSEQDQRTVEVEERIDAGPEEVFEYVADPARFPLPAPGGVEVDREAPRRIAWRVGGDTVEVVVTPDGAGTHVRVTHRLAGAAASPMLVKAPRAERVLALAA
jgi:uncharacterized protein YndB with AHSA1/START domain